MLNYQKKKKRKKGYDNRSSATNELVFLKHFQLLLLATNEKVNWKVS